MRIYKFIALIIPLLLATSGIAGLNSIKPRPQQMGMLAVAPIVVDGALVLVMPDNPTPVEAIVRDECVAQLTAKMGVPPVEVSYSDYDSGQVALWIGTPARFPALMDSLSASHIPGLGVLAREEEYNLLVTTRNIFIAGFDQLGMQWGLLSLLYLIAEVNGTFSIDRAYIRDWPDLAKRICTINSSVRIQSQYDYVDSLADMAYSNKMDEIEWNDPDGGYGNRSGFAWNSTLELRTRFARRGQFLTFGIDRTALRVPDKSWQEGVPILNMPMTVSSTGFTANSYGVAPSNSGFETWVSNVPTGWTMYPPGSYSTISRDAVNRHSGSSSLKWANLDGGYDWDRTVHQKMYFGAHRLFKLKLWVKTQSFSGKLRLLVLGDEPVNNHFENRRLTVSSTANWTQIVMDFSTYNADSANLWIGPDVYSTGNMWIDDITVEPAGFQYMVRRDETPLVVRKQPGNITMTEGVDFTVTDLTTPTNPAYVHTPQLARTTTGALPVGTQVNVDWYTAILFQGGRETVCFRNLEALEFYQGQIAALDSGIAPDGIKIHINEVSLAGYDPLCVSSGMTPGQLCGWHCNQLYNIIQARCPGIPVRIYGDAFDVWVDDNRAHPVSTSPWTVGALQQLNPNVEMMAMSDYSTNLDSTFAYFNANGHDAVMAYYGTESFSEAVNGAVSARRAPNCVGVQFYDWDIGVAYKLPDFAALGWNLGPFFKHDPLEYATRPDTIRLMIEAWADSFLINQAPSIVSKFVTYRFLPGGNWITVTPTSIGTNRYQSKLPVPPTATSIEYYFRATDHRAQESFLPPDAPVRVFSAAIPPASGNDNVDPHKYSGVVIPHIDGNVIDWPPVAGALGYEIHWSPGGDTTRRRQTLVSTVPAGQLRFYFDPGMYQNMSPEYLLVTPILDMQSANRKREAK